MKIHQCYKRKSENKRWGMGGKGKRILFKWKSGKKRKPYYPKGGRTTRLTTTNYNPMNISEILQYYHSLGNYYMIAVIFYIKGVNLKKVKIVLSREG